MQRRSFEESNAKLPPVSQDIQKSAFEKAMAKREAKKARKGGGSFPRKSIL